MVSLYEPVLTSYSQALASVSDKVDFSVNSDNTGFRISDSDIIIEASLYINPNHNSKNFHPFITLDQKVREVEEPHGHQILYDGLDDRYERLDLEDPDSHLQNNGFRPLQGFIDRLYGENELHKQPPTVQELSVELYLADVENWTFRFEINNGMAIWLPYEWSSIDEDPEHAQKVLDKLSIITDPVVAFNTLVGKLVRWQDYTTWPDN